MTGLLLMVNTWSRLAHFAGYYLNRRQYTGILHQISCTERLRLALAHCTLLIFVMMLGFGSFTYLLSWAITVVTEEQYCTITRTIY